MTTHYVRIDYENVQPDLLPLLDDQQMRVIVFVGAGRKSVPFEFAAAIQRLGLRATWVRLSSNGSNALDFHIAFYPGMLIVRDSAAHLHIISKDTGYDPLIQHRNPQPGGQLVHLPPVVGGGSYRPATSQCPFQRRSAEFAAQ